MAVQYKLWTSSRRCGEDKVRRPARSAGQAGPEEPLAVALAGWLFAACTATNPPKGIELLST